jgi:hypothetical protein
MSEPIAYEDAVDLLDADHKRSKRFSSKYNALCEDGAAAGQAGRRLKICQALTVHAQIEEEIFYPAVREAIADDALMDEALQEHAEAKERSRRSRHGAGRQSYDARSGTRQGIDDHVLEEREQIFLKARLADLDLRGMVPELVKRKEACREGAPRAAKVARMKALGLHGPRDVKVKESAGRHHRASHDVLVKITSTNICGSDLHMYEGPTTWNRAASWP